MPVAQPWTSPATADRRRHVTGLQGRLIAAVTAPLVLIRFLWKPTKGPERLVQLASPRERRTTATNVIVPGGVSELAFTTGS